RTRREIEGYHLSYGVCIVDAAYIGGAAEAHADHRVLGIGHHLDPPDDRAAAVGIESDDATVFRCKHHHAMAVRQSPQNRRVADVAIRSERLGAGKRWMGTAASPDPGIVRRRLMK